MLTPLLQEQALHAVHCIVMLVDKDTCPRPEKYPGLQVSQEHMYPSVVFLHFSLIQLKYKLVNVFTSVN